jgi:hypothetical protein
MMHTLHEFTPVIDKKFWKRLYPHIVDKCNTGHEINDHEVMMASGVEIEFEGWLITFTAYVDTDNQLEVEEITFSPIMSEPFNAIYA